MNPTPTDERSITTSAPGQPTEGIRANSHVRRGGSGGRRPNPAAKGSHKSAAAGITIQETLGGGGVRQRAHARSVNDAKRATPSAGQASARGSHADPSALCTPLPHTREAAVGAQTIVLRQTFAADRSHQTPPSPHRRPFRPTVPETQGFLLASDPHRPVADASGTHPAPHRTRLAIRARRTVARRRHDRVHRGRLIGRRRRHERADRRFQYRSSPIQSPPDRTEVERSSRSGVR